jgi:proline dehydrogenase
MQLNLLDNREMVALDMVRDSADTSFLDAIPLKMVLWLAAPYLAGHSPQAAINMAHRIYDESKFAATLDILGEDADTVAECDAFVQMYKDLIDGVVAKPIVSDNPRQQMTISIKPSMFCDVIPEGNHQPAKNLDDAYARIRAVCEYAKQRNINLTLEAEDHNWTDFQLSSYFALIDEGYTNLGTVLQSRLFRTRNDVRRFDERMRVRLVIGIYNEAAAIAHTQKPMMKEVLIELAEELFRRGTYVELASHDTQCLQNFFMKAVVPKKIPASRFETQFLLGVPRKRVQKDLVSGEYFSILKNGAAADQVPHLSELEQTGSVVRLYLPYGEDKLAAAYCRRRLKANPNMIAFGIKNFLHLN